MRMKTVLGMAALTAVLTLAGATVSFAGEWEKDYDGEFASWYRIIGDDYYGWKYRNDDGTYVKNSWVGNYYMNDRGYMLSAQITPDGYLLNQDGSWYAASPENAKDTYKMFRLYQYASQYDHTSKVTWYREEDFNGDGVLDLLTMDFGGNEISQQLELNLYTIQDGTVRKTDSYTGIMVEADTQPRAFFRWYEGKKTLFCLDWYDNVESVLTIDAGLKFQQLFSEHNQVAVDQKDALQDFWIWGERDFSDCELMELSYDGVDSLLGGQCQGKESSSSVSYRHW